MIEPLDHVRSVSLGVWVKTGSRHEPDHISGVSHFLEHLLFKGTSSRSAKSIAKTIDTLGGQLDAFTCREQSCYFAKVLDKHLWEALDLLSDLLTDPLLAPEDIERERRVVLEEINLVEDTPSDAIFDAFYATIFDGHPLGRPILGTPTTVSMLKRDDIVSWRTSNLFPENLVISVSGSCKPEEVVEAVSRAFSFPSKGLSAAAYLPASPGRRFRFKKKASEQVHMCLGFPAVDDASPQRYAASLLSTIVGGGVASRLFQRIREEEGLAYAIHSFLDTYSDTGTMGIYAGVSSQSVLKVLDLINEDLNSIIDHRVGDDELSMAKDQLKGHITLALEDTASRMSRLARQLIIFGRHFTLEETLSDIDSVTLEDVQSLAGDIFAPENHCLSLIGPIDAERLESQWLNR